MLNWLLPLYNPPSPRQGKQTNRGAGQTSVSVTSCPQSCLSTSEVLAPLWQTGLQLVSQSWSVNNIDTQRCTAVYWHKQAAAIGMKVVAGHSDPRAVRTNPATRRVESSSTMIGSVLVKVLRAMRASTDLQKQGHLRQNFVFLLATMSFCEEKNGYVVWL